MAWKDWDRTNKVVVSLCTVVAIAVLVTFAVIALRPKAASPQVPPATARPATSSSPSPSYQCTTATGPDCTKELADKEAARAKVYADSEKVLRTYFAERVKARRAGGSTGKLPPELDKVVSKERKQKELEALEAIKLAKIYYVGNTDISKIRIGMNTPEWPKDTVFFRLCVDSRNFNARKVETKEYEGSGLLVDASVTVEFSGSNWQVSTYDSKEVKEC